MEIKFGQTVFLKHNRFACNRTKNRIREHGSEGFVIQKFVPGCGLFDGRPAILFNSVTELSSDGAGGKESWVGWFPIDEIEMSESEDNA